MATITLFGNKEEMEKEPYSLLSDRGFYILPADRDCPIEGAEAVLITSGYSAQRSREEVVEIIRAVKTEKGNMPIIAIYQHYSSEDLLELFRSGVYDILREPVSSDALAETLHKALNSHGYDYQSKNLYRRLSELETTYQGMLASKKGLDRYFQEDPLLAIIIDLISVILQVDRVSLMLYDESKDELTIQAAKGLSQVAIGSSKKVGDDISGWVIRNRKPLFVNDIKGDSRFKESEFANQFTTASLISVPLILDGRLIGIININNKSTGKGFTDTDLRLLESFTRQVGLAISHILSYYEKLHLYEEILAAKSFTRTIIEGIPEGLVVIDPQDRIRTFNTVAERITSLKREDVVNRNYRDFAGLEFISACVEATVGREASDYDNIKYSNAKGEPFILRVKATILKSYGKERPDMLILFTDVTRFKAMAEKLRLSKNLILLGEAARNIGHELGNKFSGLDMFAELLVQELPPNDRRREYAKELKSGIDEVMAFLKRFKEVYKNIKILPSPLDINLLINKLIKRNATVMKQKNIALEYQPGDIPKIEGDATYLEGALLNIIINAIEAMDAEGKLSISTTVSASARGDSRVEIIISDTGRGISPEDLEKVFIPCFTTKSSGSGLGLTITQKIIEAHHGTIKLRSEANRETTFTIDLPVRQMPGEAL